jgi:hypothetical protein
MPGVVKIGHSRVCAKERCRTINEHGCHIDPYVVAWSAKFAKCVRVEKGAHRILEECRLRHDRELFVTSVEAAIEAIRKSAFEVGRYGQVQLPRLDGPRKPSRESLSLRIPALYEWLKANHDSIFERISAEGSCEADGVTPIYEDLRTEWLSSLPSDYRGRRCQPLGLFMEWGRVHSEVMFDRERNRPHLLEDPVDEEENRVVLSAVRDILDETATRRSALMQWMLDNHDEFFSMLDGKRPSWKRIAEVFTDLGLSDDGKPLSAETVRNYWWRVRQTKLGVKPKRRRKAREKAPELPPGTVRVLSTLEQAPREVEAVMERPRVSPDPVGETPVPDGGGGDEDVNGLAALRAEMAWRSGKGSKPK